MKLILDTSFILQLKRGDKTAIDALEERKQRCEDICISSLAIYELLAGASYIWKKHKDPREFLRIQDILKPLSEVAVDSEVAKKAAEIKAETLLRGRDVPDIDILIAASDDAEVLTFDGDFEPLKELGLRVTILLKS